MSRFENALLYARQLHAEQVRKGSEIPYIAHLLGVASIVMDYGGGEEEAIAALLHDAIEDQGGAPTRDEIQRRFGDRVTEIVESCTDSWVDPKPPWLERKTAYIEHVASASASVRLVSAADKLHNARSIVKDYREIGEALWSRFKGGKAGTLWYYRSLVAEFRRAELTPLVEELARVVAELEALVEKASPRKRMGTPRAQLTDMQRRLDHAMRKYYFQHPERRREQERLLEEAAVEEALLDQEDGMQDDVNG